MQLDRRLEDCKLDACVKQHEIATADIEELKQSIDNINSQLLVQNTYIKVALYITSFIFTGIGLFATHIYNWVKGH